MTGDQGPREVSEAEIESAVGSVFGRGLSVGEQAELAAFREAGFTAEQAERGVQMLASGTYFGFADAATSLAAFHHPPRVSSRGIQEAGERLEAQQKALREASTEKDDDPTAVQEIDRAVAAVFGRQVNG